MSSDSIRVVVAIDIGTSGTGVAYGACSNVDEEISATRPLQDIQVLCLNQNYPGKVPTNVVINTLDSTVCYIGPDIDQYVDEEDKAVFKSFKMHLYDPEKRSKPVLAEGDDFSMPIGKLFSACLAHLRNQFLAHNNSSDKVFSDLQDTQIRWVITVPAIWPIECRHIMREAALDAGLIDTMTSDRLVIGLEPECAAFACQNSSDFIITDGKEFLVLDCGGGTLDTAVFRVVKTNNEVELESLQRAKGNAYGSTCIDNAFFEFLEKFLFGEDEPHEDWKYEKLEVALAWKKNKDKFSGKNSSWVALNYSWDRFTKQELQERVDRHNITYNEPMKLLGKKILSLSKELMLSFIQPIAQQVKLLARQMLRENKNLDFVTLVGGFSNCQAVQDGVKEAIEESKDEGDQQQYLKYIHPPQPGSAVVSGGVWFGLNFHAIRSRVVDRWYGVAILIPWDEFEEQYPDISHDQIDEQYLYEDQRRWFVKVFKPVAHPGQRIEVSEPKVVKLQALAGHQVAKAEFYCASGEDEPIFVSNTRLLGEMHEVPVRGGIMHIELQFGATELFARVKSISGDGSESDEHFQAMQIAYTSFDAPLRDVEVLTPDNEAIGFALPDTQDETEVPLPPGPTPRIPSNGTSGPTPKRSGFRQNRKGPRVPDPDS